jgi:tRNA U38,U39,U40 pseudouridine synthase TruA
MSIWVYGLIGAIGGILGGVGIGLVILKKYRFEPGRIVDFYPFRLKAPRDLFAAIMVAFISQALLIASVSRLAYLLAGLYVGVHGFYIVYTVLMQRSGLLSKSYYLAIGLLVAAVASERLIIRILILSIAAAMSIFTQKHYEKHYKRRYKYWAQKSLKDLYRRYRVEFAKYEVEEQAVMLCFMMVENSARPPLIRFFERIYASYGRKNAFSTGIMQVKSSKILSDHESARMGFAMLHSLIQAAQHLSGLEKLRHLAYEYNGDHNYAQFLGYFYEYSALEVSRSQVSAKM